MFILIMIVVSVVAMQEEQRDPATNQIVYFKEKTEGPIGVITTSHGASVPYEDTSTLNKPLINNEFFMDGITHVTRERIPERVVHAKGNGAFGYFEVTNDMSHICKASFLKKGKKTPVAVRFSQATGERGSNELNPDVRGFAIKFYTEEGNFDIPGFNVPMYFYKDPIHFASFVHATRRNPATNLFDPKTFWDITTLLPESLQLFLLIFSGRGIPASYQNMPGFGVHTYHLVNEYGVNNFVRFHILPDAGIKNLRPEEAENISSMDPDYYTRDLFQAIGNGDFPCWTVSVQILTESDVRKARTDSVFDVTRVLPLNQYPLYEVGKLILNRNPKNFHAEIEQLAFCPNHLVRGILGAPDKIYESRRLAYKEAQMYRLGVNFNKITVNCPFQVKTFTYNRDSVPPVKKNDGNHPNYFPNTFHGPVPRMEKRKSYLIDIIEKKPYNFDQASELYANELTSEERTQLIQNLVLQLQEVTKLIRERAVKIFTTINSDLGNRVAQGLNGTTNTKAVKF